MAPPSSAHVQLDDDPRTPIQQSVGDEFRQHDGVVTMMMFYRRRASPKHCNNMTEVEYGGGGHRTRLRNDHVDQLVCSRVPPAPVYKGGRGEVRPAPRGAPGGVLLPSGVGLPPLALVEKERGEGKEERGAPPPSLSYSDLGGEGARGLPWPALPLIPHGPCRPINPREGSGNPPVLRKNPDFSRNDSVIQI